MIHLSNITKRIGSRILYENASFLVRPSDRIGLVGPNGAGKTTIFRLIMNEEHADAGTVTILPKIKVGYFSQDVGEMKGRTALEEVLAGVGKISELSSFILDCETKFGDGTAEKLAPDDFNDLMEKYGEAQLEFQHMGGYDLEPRAKAILTGLGIGPNDFNRSVEYFSGGWKMRIAMARILTLNPDVVLLDEPTNHLDIESILWLEEWLKSYKGAIVMTSHDREFMNRIVNQIVEINDRKITTYSGNYDFYLRERDLRRDQQLAAYERQQEMLAKEEDFIARFAARASHAAQVQSRVKNLEKITRLTPPTINKTIDFEFAKAPRSGNDVVEFNNVFKSWEREDGQVREVLHGITGMVKRLNKIAVTGVNGAGKSTLLKMITGSVSPTSGEIKLGSALKIGYFSQQALDLLDPDQSVYNEVARHLPQATFGFLRNLLGAFLFSGDDVDKKIGRLSGGEKSRVLLAIILASPVNLLVLDEPTNHIDIESREILMKAVQDFDGTVLVVSHDRHFLRQIVNRVFEIRQGELRIYDGTYDYYLEKREF